jgi:lysophospholipase L1-like esterase
VRYVALGDSYTIGTSVTPEDRWPDRLVAALAGDEPSLELVANLAVDGFTTADVIRRQMPALDALRPELVSLLIGVNDVVQGVDLAAYEANVATILDDLLVWVRPDRVVTVAIPDYTVTPAGADYGDPARRHDAIVAANGVMARLAADRGVAWVDIFDVSERAAADRGLVGGDGLHPSGAQYALWVERILPVVARLIGR